MHNLGNDHDARTILVWVREHPKLYGRPSCVINEEAPLGWKFIGRGSFRSVWLSPEGVAYKVSHDPYEEDCWDDQQSVVEVQNLTRLWGEPVPAKCRLPKFSEYEINDEIVVAIEMIEGQTLYERRGTLTPIEESEYYGLMNRLELELRIRDMHDENVLVDTDGNLVPVDFGY